jgi:hypothetical protein
MSEFVDFEIAIDLTDPSIQQWDGGSMPKIDPGFYVFEVTNIENVPQTNGGNPGVKFEFVVAGDATGSEETSEKGKKVTKTYSLKNDPKVLGRFKNLLVALGQPLTGFQAMATLGVRFYAEIIHREMPAQTKPDGTVTEARVVMDVMGEQPISVLTQVAEQAEAPPPPPAQAAPATARKAVATAKAAATPNGAAARR